MKPDFTSYDDAVRKLGSTVIRYKGEPVFVEATAGATKYLKICHLYKTELPKRVSYNDPDLDLSSAPLGYLNLEYNTYYVSRIPERRERMGLNSGNLTFKPEEPLQYLRTEGFYNMIMGIYPSIAEVLGAFDDNPKINSRAFHRYFAIIFTPNAIKLYYRDRIVGFFNRKMNRIEIVPSDQASFYARLLHEAQIGYEINF